MPWPAGAGDKPDIPLLIKGLSGDSPTDKPWVKGPSWRAKSEKQLCETRNRVLCPSHRVTTGKTPKRGKKTIKAFWTPLFFFFCLFYSWLPPGVPGACTKSNIVMRNSRNLEVYLDTNFRVMGSSVQYYVTALQMIKIGISLCWAASY